MAKDKELVRLCHVADCAETLKIGQCFQTRPSRNSFGKFCTLCGDVDRPTNSNCGCILRRIQHASKNGPIQELSIFDRGGCFGIDVKVLGTENFEILVWVTACTNEVLKENARQIVAISELRDSCRREHWAKGDLEQESQSLMKNHFLPLIRAHEIFHMLWTGFSKKTAFLTWHSGKREDDGPVSWEEYTKCMKMKSSNQIKGLTPCHIPGKLTSQTKKETEFLGKKDR